jgi:hypothetical protein
MDKDGLIYLSEGEVPEADAARLDGFLRGRAESDIERKKLGEQLAEFKAKHEAEIARLERERAD